MVDSNIIRKLWQDPTFSGSFTGLLTFKNELKAQKGIIATDKELRSILSSIPQYLQNSTRKRTFPRRPYYIHGYLSLVQADLGLIYPSDGYRWIFVAVDVYTSFVWAWPIKNKETATIQGLFKKIFENGIPNKIETDQDKYI